MQQRRVREHSATQTALLLAQHLLWSSITLALLYVTQKTWITFALHSQESGDLLPEPVCSRTNTGCSCTFCSPSRLICRVYTSTGLSCLSSASHKDGKRTCLLWRKFSEPLRFFSRIMRLWGTPSSCRWSTGRCLAGGALGVRRKAQVQKYS